MLTIKITLWDLFQGIQDWVNNTLNTDLNLFDVNYSEFYIYPKKVDLYIKQEKGKKITYKKIDHFFTTKPMESNLHITLEDHVTIEEKLDLEFNLAIEKDYNNNYRVYNTENLPKEGGPTFDCKTLKEAQNLIHNLNILSDKDPWVWS